MYIIELDKDKIARLLELFVGKTRGTFMFEVKIISFYRKKVNLTQEQLGEHI